jgi:type I restriction enzyme R subunit
VQARSFTELLERSIRRYQNRPIETAQVIEELIALARDMRAANARGEELGLSEDELASMTRSKPTTARSRYWASRP